MKDDGRKSYLALQKDRKPYLKSCPFRPGVSHLYPAFMFFNNSITNGKPQAGAFAGFFGGKKGIEDLVGFITINTAAIVFEQDFNEILGLSIVDC